MKQGDINLTAKAVQTPFHYSPYSHWEGNRFAVKRVLALTKQLAWAN
jgi:hypothetical protein